MSIDRRGFSSGRIEVAAGPWRTSGEWWEREWDRDEWDVALAGGVTYRLFRERRLDASSADVSRRSRDAAQAEWFVEGLVD